MYDVYSETSSTQFVEIKSYTSLKLLDIIMDIKMEGWKGEHILFSGYWLTSDMAVKLVNLSATL